MIDDQDGARMALRLLQMADDLIPFAVLSKCREQLLTVEDQLGEYLELECSSDDPRDHNGDTCPIHESL